jgi:hypothetical protein
MAKKTITHAILENLASPNPRTSAELAEELGVSIDSIYQKLSRLRHKGKIKPFVKLGNEQAPPSVDPETVAKLLKEAQEENRRTLETRLREQRIELAAAAREAKTEAKAAAKAAFEAEAKAKAEREVEAESTSPPPAPDYSALLTDISAELLAKIAAEPVVTDLMRMKWMSYALRVGPWPIKLQANKILEEMGRARTGAVGPPTPLTHDAKVERLARIFLALNDEALIDEAKSIAFSKEPPNGAEDPSPTNPEPPPSGATPDGEGDVGGREHGQQP